MLEKLDKHFGRPWVLVGTEIETIALCNRNAARIDTFPKIHDFRINANGISIAIENRAKR